MNLFLEKGREEGYDTVPLDDMIAGWLGTAYLDLSCGGNEFF